MNTDALSRLREFFREEYGAEPERVVSVPGRLDFLNTHQDYKGLPVVSIGVNLRCYTGITRSSGGSSVASLNMAEEGLEHREDFTINDLGQVTRARFTGYLKAVVKTLLDKGFKLGEFKAGIYSEVPIASGMGSSAALEASFTGALNALFNLGLTPGDVAEYSYIAEHDVLGVPCGRLDQYGCVYGGVALIETKPPYRVEELPWLNAVIAVVDSGVRHSTGDIHPRRQAEIDEGLKAIMEMNPPGRLRSLLGYRYWEPKWDLLDPAELEPYLDSIPDTPRRRILFTLEMHRSTIEALKAMRGEPVDESILGKVLGEVEEFTGVRHRPVSREEVVGALMTYQHILLRNLYDVSLPVIDEIVVEAVRTGAYGAKLSGAGLGGVVIALFRSRDDALKAVRSIAGEKGRRWWIVEIDKGLTIHY